MKIVYKFANGEKAVVDFNDFKDEVGDDFCDELYSIIFEMNEEWRKSDRREDDPERHDSLEVYNDKFKFAEDKHNLSVNDQVFKNLDKDKLYAAISKLTYSEQDFIKAVFLQTNPLSYSEYAQQTGVKESSLYQKLWRIKQKLSKFLKK